MLDVFFSLTQLLKRIKIDMIFNIFSILASIRTIDVGHCLIISRRVVPRFTDLTPEEVSDLWHTAQVIANPLQTFFKGEALNLAIQDGPAAGQSVPHVHVHLIPRKKGDFKRNDQVYNEIDKTDLSRNVTMDAEEDRKPRTLQEMAEEAAILRPLFTTSLPIPDDVESADN